MEPTVIIRHRAGLVLRLLDTATGQEIYESETKFSRNGERIRPMLRSDGRLVFLNFPLEECELTVEIAHYLPATVTLRVKQLEQRPPLVQLQLVPDGSFPNRYHTFSGKYPGIEQIDAVRLSDNACLIREFDERRRIMTLFNPHHLALDRIYYAVVNPDVCTYEPVEITEQNSDIKFRIDRKLQGQIRSHFPVARRVFGTVRQNGEYLLRVPADSSVPQWLVRWRCGGTDRFHTVDFSLPGTAGLPPDADAEISTG